MSETISESFLQMTFAACRFHRYLRASLRVLEPGIVEVDVPWFEDLDQAMGKIHGGVYSAVLDTASYYAALSAYPPMERLPLTQEYKINLVASVEKEALIARSQVVKRGRRVAVVETRIRSESVELAALGLTSLVVFG